MAMEARLSLRQSQRVVMTPLLQQAIQLLQLSTLELQEVVQKELLENPLLEEVTPDTPETPADAPVTPDSPPAPTVEQVSTDAPPTTERQTDELPFDFNAVMSADDDHEERSLVSQEDREDLPFENVVRTQVSLADHLEEQLRFVAEDAAVRRIGAEIIGNLDEDGYLRAELEEIAQRCNATAEEVTRVLELVQGFDPPGVAARSIQECLLLQLKRDPLPDPVSVEIIEAHFDDLSRRRYPDIARALKLPVDRIMESVEEIMGLEPKPGRRFGGNDSRYIVPDVYVYKLGNEYTIVLNEDGIPRLRVNSLYRSLLRNSGVDEARQYVEQKLRSALWLIKSVDQRQRTLRKVTQSIVKFQRDFLDRGLPHLRPLSLRDVGEDIGMHESTISRVTTNKYVETPQGLFELKFFFHSGIASGDGEMVSSVSVKKMIQDLLANEDPSKPLSDQEVALILKGRGLTIARRTVAKYREELGILPSHQRRLAPRRRRGGGRLLRGQRGGARAALPRDAAAASAGAGRQRARRHPRRAQGAVHRARSGRSRRGHLQHDRAPAQGHAHRGLRDAEGAAEPRGLARLVRLQARRAVRRRPRVRRALPAQPPLRREAAAARRPRARGARVRDEARGEPRAAAPHRGLPALRPARLSARGQGVPDDRRRLHGRPAPLGRPRRGAAPVRPRARSGADPGPPRHRPRVTPA